MASDGDGPGSMATWGMILVGLVIFWGLMCTVVPGVSDFTFALVQFLGDLFNV